MKTIRILLALLLAMAILQGCGSKSSGGSSSSSSTVRLVNATTNFASLDMLSSSVVLASAITTGNASSYAPVASGAVPLTLELSGSGTPSAQANVLLSAVPFSVVAFTGGQQLRMAAVSDNEPAPALGSGKLRVLNLAQLDSGNVDVYVVPAGGSLATASTLVGNFGGASGYFGINKGTYRVAVTGVGNKADLRLDLPSVVIADQQILTLILTSTAGGVLVDGWLATQQTAPAGAVVAQQNASARVRVAANIEPGATVDVTANGVPLDASQLVSPALDIYALVPAGTLAFVVNGAACPVANSNAAAGGDLTLLVVGTTASPQCFLISDDNRLPLNGLAKLRVVHGINGLAGSSISLTADVSLVAQNVAFGTASTAATIVTTGNPTDLQVNAPGNVPLLTPPFSLTLRSQGVYSMFMLEDLVGPVPIVRADR